MPCQLPADCLNEIFENLEEDNITLHSCLLVNRLWCEISVRILWKDIWRFKDSVPYKNQQKVASAIINTLIVCLPDKSKEILHKNGITQAPISKPPLFNYASFFKVLSVNGIIQIINESFKNDIPMFPLSVTDRNYLILKEIIKLFMNHQVSSLKKLTYYSHLGVPDNILSTYILEESYCLTYLSALHCSSNIHSEFFRQLSRICHNLQSIDISFKDGLASNELKELISSQNNLKNLKLSAYGGNSWSIIIPALTKHSDTLTKLHIYGDSNSLSFISSFSNLQELIFEVNFEELQHISFPKLHTLKISCLYPEAEFKTKFLEINGKNLEELYVNEGSRALNLLIARFCPNLKRLFVVIDFNEISILKDIFKSCQYLESIKIWCDFDSYLSEKEVLEAVALHSPKSFYKLKILNWSYSGLLPEDLESFFENWKNRVPNRSLSLIIIRNNLYNGLEKNKENMKIIKKYKNLGVIKKFETKYFCDDEDDFIF